MHLLAVEHIRALVSDVSDLRMANPQGVAVDTNGNVYIADSNNNRVRIVYSGGLSGLGYTAGDIYTIAGYGPAGYSGDGGPAGNAELWDPIGLAVYVDTTYGTFVYVSDWQNNYVRQIKMGGNIVAYAGHPYNTSVSSPGSYAGNGVIAASTSVYLFDPEGLAVDSYGNLYIADTANDCIREVMYRNAGTKANKIYTVAGQGAISGFSGDGGASTSAKLNTPEGVAVDSSFNVYIADSANNRIRMVTTTNTTSGSSQTTPLAGNIITIAGNGTGAYGGDGGYSNSSSVELYNPKQLAMDSSNNLYVADTYNQRIRVIANPFPYY